jgi:hypothetical protein
MYCKPTSPTTADEYSYRQLVADHTIPIEYYEDVDEEGNPVTLPVPGTGIATSFPPRSAMSEEQWTSRGAYPVVETTRPVIDEATQRIDGYSITGSGSSWTQVWNVVAKTQEEQDAYAESLEASSARQSMRSDNEVRQLLKATPNQINNFIDNNVTDLDSAKDVLKRLARAVSVLGRELVD